MQEGENGTYLDWLSDVTSAKVLKYVDISKKTKQSVPSRNPMREIALDPCSNKRRAHTGKETIHTSNHLVSRCILRAREELWWWNIDLAGCTSLKPYVSLRNEMVHTCPGVKEKSVTSRLLFEVSPEGQKLIRTVERP